MGEPVVPGGHRRRRGFGGIAKARRRKLRKGPLERRRPRVRPSLTNCSWAPARPGNGAHTKAHKNKRSEPTTDSEPAGTRRLSRVSLFFRAFAIQPAPTSHPHRPPDTPEARGLRPLSSFRAFVCRCSATPTWIPRSCPIAAVLAEIRESPSQKGLGVFADSVVPFVRLSAHFSPIDFSTTRP